MNTGVKMDFNVVSLLIQLAELLATNKILYFKTKPIEFLKILAIQIAEYNLN